jgi:nicotinate phosphoribosyltransferase
MATEQLIDAYSRALFTDLYELSMLQAYYAEGMMAPAVFELYFRELPMDRNYVMVAGLDDVLQYLETLHINDDEVAWLRQQRQFDERFLQQLGKLRFTGDVYAVPEGTVMFENEPVLQVVAPLPEAQFIETYVLNQIHVQSVVASKAARVVTAAQGRQVVDFGSRRSHGADAALKVARASYLAGAAGTSNVAAGRLYDIPIYGTMAHSYIQAHDDELSAFRAFVRQFPQTTLLVDTYDTLNGVQAVIELARELGDDFKVGAIRLDSGDLAELSKGARALLDTAGLHDVKIIASSGLDEHKIAALLAADAPINGFGVGTKLAVSRDAPDIDFSYKLVDYNHRPCMKLSPHKYLLPGRKQIFRVVQDGRLVRDVIARHGERLDGEALLRPVMRHGKRLDVGRVSLTEARKHAEAQLQALPAELRQLTRVEPGYRVDVSPALQAMADALQGELQKQSTEGRA